MLLSVLSYSVEGGEGGKYRRFISYKVISRLQVFYFSHVGLMETDS